MPFIINHINNHLMIHFSDIVTKAVISIINESNDKIEKTYSIQHQEFSNISLELPTGTYRVEVKTAHSENSKTIIVK